MRQLEILFGYSDGAIRKAVAAGRLHPLHRGVYAVGHTEVSSLGECLAAVLAVGPGSLLSYESAGWLHGLVWTLPASFDVTAPGPRRLRARPSVKVHRARNLASADRALVENVPVTSVARTLLDLAEGPNRRKLPRYLEQAEKRGTFDYYEALAVCERSRGHRGSKPLRAAIAGYRPGARLFRSDLEKRFLALVEAAGIPLPATNYVVGPYELDAYWAEHNFGVELDTYATHGSRRSFESDRERDATLLEAGVTTIRVTERQLVADPAAVVHRLEVLLRPDAGRRRRASPPLPV